MLFFLKNAFPIKMDTMKQRLVIFIDSVHPILEERLTQAGFQCELHYQTSFEELKNILPLATGIVIRSRFTIHEEFLAYCPALQFIARAGSGLENIDAVINKILSIKQTLEFINKIVYLFYKMRLNKTLIFKPYFTITILIDCF